MQIEKTLIKIPEVGHNYIIEVKKENFMDKIYIKVEVNEETFKGTINELEHLQKEINEELKNELGVNPIVKFVESGSLPQSEGKAIRVYDLREKE
jgi:phenylacetate-CoA ligase